MDLSQARGLVAGMLFDLREKVTAEFRKTNPVALLK